MFARSFIYRLKRLTRNRIDFFWSFFFPLILGTMFALSFGKVMSEGDTLDKIPVSIVRGDGEAVVLFNQVAASVDFLDIQKVSDEKEALKKLENGDIAGIIYVDDTLSLTVLEEGLESSILKTFLDELLQYTSAITTILTEHPEKMQDPKKIQEVVSSIEGKISDITYTKHKALGKDLSSFVQFFYSLFAMCLMFGCFPGVTCACDLQANLSAVGARRNVSSAKKQSMLLADFLASVFVQILSGIILLLYLNVVLKINLGSDYLHMLLIIIVGSLIGIASGVFIGSFSKIGLGTKVAIVLAFSMTSCFLSGLMVANVKFWIETHAPIINKINPASLITNCFYSLNALDSMDKYYTNILILLVEAIILCAASFLMTRRLKHASI